MGVGFDSFDWSRQSWHHNVRQSENQMNIRDATPFDFPAILQLNDESVHFLSPLTPGRLAFLHKQTSYHRVVESGGRVIAFLLALNQGSSYDSPNYRWFAANYAQFLYIDRVVVASEHQGRGAGRLLYGDIFAFARHENVNYLTCEFDLEPPNEPSRRFHEGQGFREVGTQSVAAGKKQVSLQAIAITLEMGESSQFELECRPDA